jgi:hypothetical protein
MGERASFFLDFLAGVRYILVGGTVHTSIDSDKIAVDAHALFPIPMMPLALAVISSLPGSTPVTDERATD